MVYTDVSIPLPDDSHYEVERARDNVFYVKLRLNSFRVNGKLKHKRILIGRLANEEVAGIKYFHPNNNYYSHFGKEAPSGGACSNVGRPAKKTIPVVVRIPEDHSIAFGYTLACHSVARELQLDKLLEESFNRKLANKILAVSAFLAAGAPSGLSNIEDFSRKHMCFTDCVITSQVLSELYSDILMPDCYDFFRRWIKLCCEDDYVCYDVTSISSYSEQLPLISFGYNRDHENLPQANVGMFCTIKRKLPVFFSCYNGSINDFTNLPYVLEQAASAGLRFDRPLTLVMDGGFAVKHSLEDTRQRGCEFIVGAPLDFCDNIRERVLNWRHDPFDENSEVIIRDNESIRCKVEEYSIGSVRTRLMMYKSPKAALKDETFLTSTVTSMEETLRTESRLGAKTLKKYGLFFDITELEKGYQYQLKDSYFKSMLELCGCFAIFCTRDDLSPEEVLDIYRSKDCVEKAFGAFKNDILDDRLRVKKAESINGKLFLAFIGLIIRKALENKLRPWIASARSSFDAAASKLGETACLKKGEKWVLLSAPTKQQKEIIKALNLPVHYLQQTRTE